MALITTEMLFENNVKQITAMLENNYGHIIQADFEREPGKYPDLLTWMELHPEEVGKIYVAHLINYGFSNEDIQ